MKRTLKWIFFVLWLFCLGTFVAGQFLAPPEYHLLLGNFWGNLFGFTVILGLISFCLTILFTILGFLKDKKNKESQKINKKYNLSFDRIASRLFLAILIGFLLKRAIAPFMNKTNDLLFAQQAILEKENFLKEVVLLGVFVLIILLFTLLKKHFRMVGLFLVIYWFANFSLFTMRGMYGANSYSCKRTDPYSLPKEFNRSLDLIAQRMDVDNTANGTIWQSAFNFRNCLNIQYLENDDSGAEAYFFHPTEKNLESLQNLKIMVNPSYKNFDDLTLAALLSHEIVHVGDYINEVIIKTNFSCYEQEARAFAAQHAFIISLNEEEQRSIYSRLKDNVDENPTFKITLLTAQRAEESVANCVELQKHNNLTDEQTNKCVWDELESKLLRDVQENPYYQQQCEI